MLVQPPACRRHGPGARCCTGAGTPKPGPSPEASPDAAFALSGTPGWRAHWLQSRPLVWPLSRCAAPPGPIRLICEVIVRVGRGPRERQTLVAGSPTLGAPLQASVSSCRTWGRPEPAVPGRQVGFRRASSSRPCVASSAVPEAATPDSDQRGPEDSEGARAGGRKRQTLAG